MERVINIMLVEDDRIDQNAVKRELIKRKILYKLIIVTNTDDAIQWMRESSLELVSRPDIILLDLNTGGIDGFEFLAHLRIHPEWKKCKVFVLTGSDDPLARAKAVSFHVSGYIVKPLKLEQPSSADVFHLIVDIANLQQHSPSEQQ